MVKSEPQSAADYPARSTAAVRQTLVEIGQILGGYEGKFAVVGGAVPWLLLEPDDMVHVGTFDIDLALDPVALGDTEYADLVHALQAHGYERGPEDRAFQLTREVPAEDDGPPIKVVVDFLMPRDAEVPKRERPLVKDFAVQKAHGADLAIDFQALIEIEDRMPGRSGTNRVKIAVASIPALLGMKGHALVGRFKRKDAYDIYYCVRNYPGGPEALAEACRPLLERASALQGYEKIAGKFREVDDHGPTCVREFVESSAALGDRTPEQWQTDAYGQVRAFLDALGL